MSIDQVLIGIVPGETRVALVEDGRLCELMVSRPDLTNVTGNIYLGRVERVLSGIQAAFVDIGLDRSGFLALPEARPPDTPGDAHQRITDYVSEGDSVLVQALNDPVADKGAKVTTHATIPGRHLVLTPGQPGIKMSRRIDGEAERARLSDLVAGLAEGDEGYIVRTAATGAGEDALERDVSYLRATWEEIEEKIGNIRIPACLYREFEPLRRVLRDETGPQLQSIVIDDAQALAEARRFCARLAPDLEHRLHLHEGEEALFEAHGIEEQIEAALAPRVPLPGGGNIVIDEATALIAIDVNTGGRGDGGPEDTALRTNLEAAHEIARQVRLRGIAGIVVIDFVPMRRHDNGAEVLQALRHAVAADRCPTNVIGFTRLGLVEMTRQRRRPSLLQTLLAACHGCAGGGRVRSAETVAFEVLRTVLREAGAAPGIALEVRAAPAVVKALQGPAATAFEETAARLGGMLEMVADAACPQEVFEVGPANDD